jgi:hypothetical protein
MKYVSAAGREEVRGYGREQSHPAFASLWEVVTAHFTAYSMKYASIYSPYREETGI